MSDSFRCRVAPLDERVASRKRARVANDTED
jgi:hypothetical protein